jgi:hypothetical protein
MSIRYKIWLGRYNTYWKDCKNMRNKENLR